MKEYKLIQTEHGIEMYDADGKLLPATDVLQVYPDRRVYAFYGQMGAGKTTFIKQLCEEMGVEDVVNSPTFAIVNVYERLEVKGEGLEVADNTLCREIYHFDCYRLKNLQEAMDMGAEDYLYSGNYCFIEWPEMIEDLLPEETVRVYLSTTLSEGERILKVE